MLQSCQLVFVCQAEPQDLIPEMNNKCLLQMTVMQNLLQNKFTCMNVTPVFQVPLSLKSLDNTKRSPLLLAYLALQYRRHTDIIDINP